MHKAGHELILKSFVRQVYVGFHKNFKRAWI